MNLPLEPPCALINANQRLHHHPKAVLTRTWRQAAEQLAWVNPRKRPLYSRAHVTVAIRFPNNIRRDVGNYYPTAKAIVDGLIDAGFLADDNDAHLIGPDMRRTYPNGTPLVTVTIEETQ